MEGRAGTRRGNLQGGRLSSARARPQNGQPWEAVSNLFRGKPARADREGIPFVDGRFTAYDLQDLECLYLWVSQ